MIRGGMVSIYSQYLATPVGRLRVVGSSRGLCRICFPAETEKEQQKWFSRHRYASPAEGSHPLVEETVRQLGQYFEGKRRFFDVSLDLQGTPFQLRVWKALLGIPFGSTISYGEVADRIGKPGANQAVGSAVGSNPVPIIVACHRVVGGDGALVGFGGGLPAKQKLLELEGTLLRVST